MRFPVERMIMRRRTSIGTLLSASLLMAACAGDGTTTTTDPSEGPGEAQIYEVIGVDYAFEGLPDSIPSGSQLTLTNTSDREVHELVALRLPDDEERPAEELMMLPEEELDVVFGEDVPPAMVLVAPPGETGFAAVGDGTVSEPGRYLIFCAIPIGADPDEFMAAAEGTEEGPPQVAGGPPHFVEGMVDELVVTEG